MKSMVKLKQQSLVFFLLIILTAIVLRFFQLGINPPSLTWDEVAWGYNAYSLGIDGRDEFGRFLPYNYLESFGDFKPPMYAYLDVIPVKVFGLIEFAARFPSALFGVATVAMTYYLVLLLFDRSGKKQWYAFAASAILAISPWHIMLSRAAFEANIATFFLVTGVTCFIYAMQKKPWLLSASALSFVFSMYTFNTSRIVAPLLVIVLILSFWKKLWQMKKTAITAGIIGLIVLAPIVPFLLSPQAKLRFQEVNIFSDVAVIKTANQEITNDQNAAWSKLIHNRRLLFAGDFMQHYLDNLSFHFLFITGDGNPKFSVQDVGQMYLWELPFLLLGVVFIFRNREGKWYLLPAWLLLAIIPAATARETPHALRIETTLPTFQIFVAYGLVNFLFFINEYKWIGVKSKVLDSKYINGKKIIYAILSIVVFVNLVYFLHSFYVTYPREWSGEWQYGYKDAINYVSQVQNSYDHIVMTTALGRPYIYYLFYLHIPPSYFRQNAIIHRDAFGFVNVEQVGKYIFTDTVPAKQNAGKVLYIADVNGQIPANAKVLKTFYLLNGTPVLKAYTL